ncbi:MAG: hypothetical protein GX964_09500 [Syntrophomonadaceae bacterium]|jgi:hypothetical protein|nr:hypothetical protein [Syntrophomonadaceae bacterium]
MWIINEQGQREFRGGKEDWEGAAHIAAECSDFQPDDEDEMIADEPVSCYNCFYRRWTASSFTCCRPT